MVGVSLKVDPDMREPPESVGEKYFKMFKKISFSKPIP